MDAYLDLRLRSDPEIHTAHLMAAVYTRLHRQLVALRCEDIGISFPEIRTRPRTLGNQLRLHGPATALQAFSDGQWLGSLREHCQLGSIAAVPTDTRHRTLRRVQTKSSPERLRRRLMRRHGIDEAEARRRIPDAAARELQLPYIAVHSSSTGQHFKIFLEQGPPLDRAQPGRFNAYGLSQDATVPWF